MKDHPSLGTLYEELGSSYEALGNAEKSMECRKEAIRIYEGFLGDHKFTATSYLGLGTTLKSQGKFTFLYFRATLNCKFVDARPGVNCAHCSAQPHTKCGLFCAHEIRVVLRTQSLGYFAHTKCGLFCAHEMRVVLRTRIWVVLHTRNPCCFAHTKCGLFCARESGLCCAREIRVVLPCLFLRSCPCQDAAQLYLYFST